MRRKVPTAITLKKAQEFVWAALAAGAPGLMRVLGVLFLLATAAFSQEREAADQVLAAFQAKDATALQALAAKDNPDPWLVTDELCARGEHNAAEAFAKAAPRKDIEELPAYVASRRGKPANAAAREALAASNKALLARDPKTALAAIETVDAKAGDVVSVRLLHGRGNALKQLRREEEALQAYLAAADAAERLGWLARTVFTLREGWGAAFRSSNWRAALAAAERVLAILVLRGDRAGAAQTLSGVGHLHLRLGSPAKALDCAERALELNEELENRAGVAASLVNIGILHSRLGAHTKALEYQERALKLNEELGNPANVAASLINIGILHQGLGAHTKALASVEKGLKQAEAIGHHQWTANALGTLGNIHTSLGSFAKALEYQERSLRLAEQLGNRAGEAQALLGIGGTHLRLGSYARALDYSQRSLKLMEELGNPAGVAEALGVVGVIQASLGSHARALEYQERSLKLAEQLGNRAGVADALSNIGDIHRKLGSYAKSLEYQERSLELNEALGNRAGVAIALANLGNIHFGLGSYARALEYQERALTLVEEQGDRARVIKTLANIGIIHGHLGSEVKELEYYERALALSEALGNRDVVAVILGNIGVMHKRTGSVAKALEYHERALQLKEELGDRAGVAITLANIGHLNLELGNLEVARRYLERSVRTARSIRTTPVLVQSLGLLARLHLEAGKPSRALAAAQRALREIEGLLGGLGEEQGAQAREQHAALFAVGTLAAVREQDIAEALTFMESGRAGALLDALGRREALRWKAESLSPELRRLDREAQAKERAARRAYDAAAKGGKRKELRAAAAALDDATGAVRAVTGRIQRELKQQARLFYPRAETIDTVQAALEEDQALVLYGLCPDEVVALVLRHDGERVVSLGTIADVEAAYEAFDPTDPEVDPKLGALRELLVDPLGLGEDVKQVLVSPEGPLCYLPFGALFEQPVAMTPSGTTHVLLMNEERAKGEGILALGDPDYKGASKGAQAIYYKGRTLEPLPATRKEAEAIGTTTLLGAKASEAGFYRALEAGPAFAKATAGASPPPASRRWRAVQFGCHGLVNVEQPMLSSLALAREGDHDGFLTALEVLRTRIPADLAVLSACETARGKIVKGEGIVGLTRAFMFAGTPRVICSLWKVDDDATQALMVKFYELWKTQPTATALQNAQKYVRGHDKWKHPYYWAAWQLWGLPD